MMQGFEKMLKAMGIDVPALKQQTEDFVAEIRGWFASTDERITRLEARVRELEMGAGFEPDKADAAEGAARTEFLPAARYTGDHVAL